jgi:superfamily II DNA or RNA helicase/diadenosine tetraphosphate (Ap4A) HIT family hydrolase
MTPPPSPFLQVPPGQWLSSNPVAFAIPDKFPVSPGHTLVVPRRLIATWWEATAEERFGLLELVDTVKEILDREHHPDGYNVGFNAGAAAGQTIDHLHIHVIPRYTGDTFDPRGGIRHALPGRGNYLAESDPSLLDNHERSVLDALRDCLRDHRFDRADLIVSFVMRSGLTLIGDDLQEALERGVRIRLLTTDYLQTTEPDALARLLDLAEDATGRLEVRVFSDETTSFHPKGYLFRSSTTGICRSLVGSSNLSRSGISLGIEWTLATHLDAGLAAAFERAWADSRNVPLTHEWLRAYRLRVPVSTTGISPTELSEEREPATPVAPRPIQVEALEAIASTVTQGHQAGLVVLATGLGKTWLAAFHARETGAHRVLFVAHREEILRQSRDVFRQVMSGCDAGLFTGNERTPDADVVFASVQSLGRSLSRWSPDHFELIVIDEFHHAAAPTYRRIIEHFRPPFLLGLTATPERMDGADLLALCGDNLVFECGLVEGISRGELCRFEYRAERDVADFAHVPWRNGRFDPEALAGAIETIDRAEQELDVWREHGRTRTLAFCCSITHAEFMSAFFNEHDVRAVALHSGARSSDRRAALERLNAGDLDIVFSVDLFNEGVDLPALDTVLMLRPTDSPVVFLQQLGRGLRVEPGKEGLVVIDFIGNHRSFLFKPRTLLNLTSSAYASTAEVIAAMRTGDFGLPDGCSVSYDIEVVDLLAELTQREQGRALHVYCRQYFDEHGRRPTAVQAWRSGYNPRAQQALGWFGALDGMDLLTDDERPPARQFGDFLRAIEREPITKSYKLVTLQAVVELGGLSAPVSVPDLAVRAHEIMRSDPRLAVDVEGHLTDAADKWERYWRQWPIAAWTGSLRGTEDSGLFRVENDQFIPAIGLVQDSTLVDLVAELIDYRLCRYLDGKAKQPGEWRLRVSQANGRPIVWLDRPRNPGLPEGEANLLIDGRKFTGVFVKIALNVVRDAEGGTNRLPGILQEWFGEHAGFPGTKQMVRISQEGGLLVMQPSTGDETESPDTHSQRTIAPT